MNLGRATLVAAVSLALISCQRTAPTSFYTLSPLTEQEAGAPGANVPPDLLIGVGPVNLPAYLDRTQLVTQISPNRVELADLDSWIEPLDGLVSRTVVDNLTLMLVRDQILQWPQQRDSGLDLRVEVNVLRFDTEADGTAILDAHWVIYEGRQEEVASARRERIVDRGADPTSYESRVAAMSRTLGEFSRRITDAIAETTG